MHTFTTFAHPTYGSLRALIYNDAPYFVASDVCRILALPARQSTLDRLDPDDRAYIEADNGAGYVVSRAGTYALAFDSTKSYAKSFLDWLSTRVIPGLFADPDDDSDGLVFSRRAAPEPQPVHNTEVAADALPSQVFTHSEFGTLSIVTIDDKEYFPAVECAEILGYAKGRNAISTHCRYALKRGVPHPQNPDKTIEKIFIPEGDLYRLIARSKLPAAEKFERWVFDEVLPSIRKHGAYMTAPVLQQVLSNPSSIIDLANALVAEHAKSAQLEQQVGRQTVLIQQQQTEIEEMRPKVTYLDTILQNASSIPVSVIAKDYGMSAVNFNKLLHELGIQYKCGKTWLLYSRYSKEGYTTSYLAENSEGSYLGVQTNWTQKGRLFLYNTLKSRRSLVPLIERESA